MRTFACIFLLASMTSLTIADEGMYPLSKIQGYSPADAMYASPITTLRGVVEKTSVQEPYKSLQKLIQLAYDYAWSQAYSRSIAVDIRCVLRVVQQFSGDDTLLAEMGVR